uniref:DEK-C domain-containing protein n=1 Tax=Oryza glumipatula TaxID=40148 RepID=A0A0D9YJE8_9ORYZ
MASDAKPDSPPAGVDPPPPKEEAKAEKEGEGEEPQSGGRKRGRRKKGEAGEAEKEKEKPPPATPTIERPSRERKTVERYSELAPRVTPAKKSPAILQGSGSKLKDIPNIQFKLSKRKADENLQSLHVLMYGRKSNVHFLKRNISQFSGFVWTDNQEKQRTRIKEKLDKFNKERLLDFCEILDIHVSRAATKKEEVSAKLLEFLESPCITRDVVLTDDKKGKKRGRRSKGNGQATAEGASDGKKRRKSRKQSTEAAKENDDEDDEGPAGSEDASMGEEDDEGSEAKDNAGSDEEPDEPPAKKKATDDKQTKKAKEKDATAKKASTRPAKGVSKPSQDTEEDDEPEVELESKKVVKKVSKSSKESDVTVDKTTKKASKSKKDEGKDGQNNNSGALNNKARKKDAAKTTNKNKGKGKGSTEAGAAPTTEELHAVVSDILKEVDFNTATLADILRQLGTHFKMDLMDRKSEVKHIIEEVINSMSDDEEGEEDNAEDDKDKNAKEENSNEDADGDEK